MAELTTLSQLSSHERNPRRIEARNKGALSAAMTRYGDLSGVVWNSRNGKLVTGHQRVSVITDAGGSFTDGALLYGEHQFPVRIVDWDEQMHLEAMAAANSDKLTGVYVADELDALIAEITEHGDKAVIEAIRLNELASEAAIKAANDADEEDKGGSRDPNPNINYTYSVVVDFVSEEEQAAFGQRIIEEGYICRLLII